MLLINIINKFMHGKNVAINTGLKIILFEPSKELRRTLKLIARMLKLVTALSSTFYIIILLV